VELPALAGAARRGAHPAGNSYLLKHAPNVLGSAELIGEIFADAGFPQGVFGWVNATNEGKPGD
jgi:succinate-semialdehyde dehydrogenase